MKHKKGGKLPIPPRRIAVPAHSRAAPMRKPPAAPMPGPNEFDAGQEQSMRAGARNARLAPPPPTGGDGDADDMDLGGM